MVGEKMCCTDTLDSLALWTRVHQNDNKQPFTADAIIQLIGLLEKAHRGWRTESQENVKLSDLNARLKRQNENYETALAESKELNRQFESELAAANAQIESLHTELREYQLRFKAANDELKNVTIRPSSVLRDSTIAYIDNEQTSEEGTGDGPAAAKFEQKSARRYKRRSNSNSNIHHNRLVPSTTGGKLAKQAKISEETTDENSSSGDKHHQQNIVRTPQNTSRLPVRLGATPLTSLVSRRRSVSAPRLLMTDRVNYKGQIITPAPLGFHTPPMNRKMQRHYGLPGFGPGWTRGRPIHSCTHQFVEERAFGKMLQNCKLCSGKLGLGFFTCKDCKISVHGGCRFSAPMPCVPFVLNSVASLAAAAAGRRRRLADFCPDTFPKVPAQLIRCVYTIEADSANGVEVYEHAEEMYCSDPGVLALAERFDKLQAATTIGGFQARTIAAYMKCFLQELKEPLIPDTSYAEFNAAAKQRDHRLLRTAVDDLQLLPNRDTLAYLCAHWQRMIQRSVARAEDSGTADPIQRLAIALAPTVCSGMPKLMEEMARKALRDGDHLPETVQDQIRIMEQLLSTEKEFWSSICDGAVSTSGSRNMMIGSSNRITAANPTMDSPIISSCCSATGQQQSSGLKADRSMLGPVTWMPTTPSEAKTQRSELVSRVKRRRPLFEKPY